jgi:hypothetical protein
MGKIRRRENEIYAIEVCRMGPFGLGRDKLKQPGPDNTANIPLTHVSPGGNPIK